MTINIVMGELINFTEHEVHAQWSALVSDTELSRTKLNIRKVPAEQQCMVCFEKYHPINKETSCPHCGSVGAKIIAGEEFFMDSNKVIDE